jgi:hypothetical protein
MDGRAGWRGGHHPESLDFNCPSFDHSSVPSFNGVPALFTEESISITVDEVNSPPTLAALATVDEGQAVPATASATDTRFPVNSLTFSFNTAPISAWVNTSRSVRCTTSRLCARWVGAVDGRAVGSAIHQWHSRGAGRRSAPGALRGAPC